MTEAPIERVRRLCLSWPDVTERLSHGEPTWFHRDKRSFATGADHHHDDRVAVWLASPPGARDDADRSESPSATSCRRTSGHRGWIGVYLDVDVDWERLEELIGNAYHTIAAPGR